LIQRLKNSDGGILPRALELIMKELPNKKNVIHYELDISFIEIYNEKVYKMIIN
jgi:hypothetical protein